MIPFYQSLLLIMTFEFLLFLLSLVLKRNDIADVGWGLGFGFVALFCFFKNPNPSPLQYALLFVVLAWSLRLSGYLAYRLRGKPEDIRYQDMRARWKNRWMINSLIYVFILQGFLLWVFAIPLIYHMSNASFEGHFLTLIPLGLSLFGLIYETIADFQKNAFKKNKENSQKIIQTGLYKYSRYPNYFGEILFWLGVALFDFSLGWHLALVFAPILLAIFLRYVSGVPLLEAKYKTRPEYASYAAKTPLFIPKF